MIWNFFVWNFRLARGRFSSSWMLRFVQTMLSSRRGQLDRDRINDSSGNDGHLSDARSNHSLGEKGLQKTGKVFTTINPNNYFKFFAHGCRISVSILCLFILDIKLFIRLLFYVFDWKLFTFKSVGGKGWNQIFRIFFSATVTFTCTITGLDLACVGCSALFSELKMD